MPEVMTSNEVAEFAQVTLRQLHWWKHYIVSSTATGSRRAYTPRQAAVARALGEMRRKRIPPRLIREALHILNRAVDVTGRFLFISLAHKPELASAEQVVTKLKQEEGAAHLVEVIEPDPEWLGEVRKKRLTQDAWRSADTSLRRAQSSLMRIQRI